MTAEEVTTIHFVRHGRVHNPLGLYYGRLLGFPLNDKGKAEASAARDYLAMVPVGAVYSSPRLRARETAQSIASAHEGKFVVVSDWLDEVQSPFDGCPIGVVQDRNWDVYTGVGPDYERPSDVLARGQRFISEVRMGHSGQQVVAVTHGDLIAFLMLWDKGLLCNPQNKQRMYEECLNEGYGSVATFRFGAGMDGAYLGMDYADLSARYAATR